MKQTLLHRLHRALGGIGTADELQRALTHRSFYGDRLQDKSDKGSRYVFAGQFGFRGAVADYLLQWVGGTGTQLQHTLGNLLKNQYLERLYDDYGLASLVRYGRGFPLDRHQHIFAYALLGFVYQHADRKAVQRFVHQVIINPQGHLMPTSTRGDLLAQVRFKSLQIWQELPHTRIHKIADRRYCFTISTDTRILGIAYSKSAKYARRKGLKIALKTLLDHEQKNPQLQARIARQQTQRATQQAEQKANKIKDYQEKKNEQRRRRQARIEARRAEAQRRDELRRKAKKRAKERLTNRSEKTLSKKDIQALLNAEGHLMNAAKRRKLEDRLK